MKNDPRLFYIQEAAKLGILFNLWLTWWLAT